MAKKPSKRAARKPNSAFMKPITPDPALAQIVGGKPIPRSEITRKLWAYIKKNGLEQKRTRRVGKGKETHPDPGLEALAQLYSKL